MKITLCCLLLLLSTASMGESMYQTTGAQRLVSYNNRHKVIYSDRNNASMSAPMTIYKSVDAHGHISYSDRPIPGTPAKAIKLEELSTYKALGLPTEHDSHLKPQPQIPYTRFEIISPRNGENFHNIHQVSVTLSVEPTLQPGHKINLLLDGTAVAKPSESLQFNLTDISRGSHQLTAQLLNADKRSIKSTSSTFFVHQTAMRKQTPIPKPKS